jgi:prevent-host-death family protein
MKTATMRQVHNDFQSVLKWVAAGEEVTVSNRGRPVARICPPRAQTPAKFKMPDFAARAKAIFKNKRTHFSNSVLQEREESRW